MTSVEDSKCLLIWHGMFLFLPGLLKGLLSSSSITRGWDSPAHFGRSDEPDLPHRVGCHLDGGVSDAH
jgi:hypothetical protein